MRLLVKIKPWKEGKPDTTGYLDLIIPDVGTIRISKEKVRKWYRRVLDLPDVTPRENLVHMLGLDCPSVDVPEDILHVNQCLKNQDLFKEITGMEANEYFKLGVVEHEGYGNQKETQDAEKESTVTI